VPREAVEQPWKGGFEEARLDPCQASETDPFPDRGQRSRRTAACVEAFVAYTCMTAVNAGQLFPAPLAAGAALVIFVNAVNHQIFVVRQKGHARFARSQEPIPIEAEFERFVEDPGLLPRFSCPEGTRLDDVIRESQISLCVPLSHIAAVRNGAILEKVQAVSEEK